MKTGRRWIVLGFLGATAGWSQQTVVKPVLSPAPEVSAPAQAAAPGAGSAANAAPAAVSPTYQIGPEDALLITVWHEQNLSGPYTVRPDGMISMPLLNDLMASGMTPGQLGDVITTRLKKYIEDPLVTVSVTAVNSKRIFLVGEIAHIGPLALTAGLTPMQAIASAGGLTTFANAKKIYVLRNVGGKEQKLPFNYKKSLKDGDSQGITLLPGDTIVVP